MTDPTPSDGTAAATSSEDPPVIGSLTDPPAGSRYRLGAEIARGGMGVVYTATDTHLNRPVAVKRLLDRYPLNSAVARRFLDEAHITGQLQHPGIPPVHDLGVLSDGRPFLAMKLVKGDTLDDQLRLRRDPAADPGRYLGVYEKVCEAVGYAHSRGVVHRDLKPANVMVGAFGEVQVMDWGLAKALTPDRSAGRPTDDPDATAAGTEIRTGREDDQFTQAGSVLGTPAYMPPEQAIGAIDQIDQRSDVFGLGGILAVILTGHPPFVGPTAESTRQMAARGELADCFARLDGCAAPELVTLCKRCLAADKADRPADAGEVAAAVAVLRAAADERAKRAELELHAATVRADADRRRRRLLRSSAGTVVTVLAAGAVGIAWQAREAGRYATAAAQLSDQVRHEQERYVQEAARVTAIVAERKRAEDAAATAKADLDRTVADYDRRRKEVEQQLTAAQRRLQEMPAAVVHEAGKIQEASRAMFQTNRRWWGWLCQAATEHTERTARTGSPDDLLQVRATLRQAASVVYIPTKPDPIAAPAPPEYLVENWAALGRQLAAVRCDREAESVLTRTVAFSAEAFGPRHPRTVAAVIELAWANLRTGNPGPAASLLRASEPRLAVRGEPGQGDDDLSFCQMAVLYAALTRRGPLHTDAETARWAGRVTRTHLIAWASDASTLSRIALTFHTAGRLVSDAGHLSEASELFSKAFQCHVRLGRYKGTFDQWQVWAELGSLALTDNRLVPARAMLSEAYREMQPHADLSRPDHWQGMAAALDGLVRLHTRLGEAADAARYRELRAGLGREPAPLPNPARNR